MVEYVIGNASEKDEIVDFINYVFSQAHAPHDFRTLSPKSYGDRAKDLGAVHYLAKKDGKIKALIATRIIDVCIDGKILKYGLIGNVAVHPYSRGEGYMKKLMTMAIDDAKERGVDIMLLGGQRQRYGYFGFENAGVYNLFKISKANIRHCFGDIDTSAVCLKPLEENDVTFAKRLYEKRMFHAIRPKDEFVDIMHTWNKECRVIYKNDVAIGYVYGSFDELVLEDEGDFALVLKAIFEIDKLLEVSIKTDPLQRERSALLFEICEHASLVDLEMVNILNYKKVLSAFFALKARLVKLQEGTVEFSVDGERLRLCVSGNEASVSEASGEGEAVLKLSHNEAQSLLFSIKSLQNAPDDFYNWLPLPLMLDAPDGY